MKAFDDVGESHIEVALDVLAKDPIGFDFRDHARDLGPEMSRIGRAATLAGLAERLAGITGSDEMNSAAPREAVKGSQIVPYRRLSQGRVRHPRHESGRSMGFPLDVTHSAISGLRDMEAEVEPTISSAEGDTAQIGGVGRKLGV
nr:hypothetical protein [Sphingomonas cavernae]